MMAERRSRIAVGKAERFWDVLGRLRIEMQAPAAPFRAKEMLTLGRKHRLTVYDAAYLELALRMGVALATQDGELRDAALKEGVVLL